MTPKLPPIQQNVIDRMTAGDKLTYRHVRSAHRDGCGRTYSIGKDEVKKTIIEALEKKGRIEIDYKNSTETANYSGIVTRYPYILKTPAELKA